MLDRSWQSRTGWLLLSCASLALMNWSAPGNWGWGIAAAVAFVGIAVAWVLYCEKVDLAADGLDKEPSRSAHAAKRRGGKPN